jgi:DNA repair protein RecO (recombination protein O)
MTTEWQAPAVVLDARVHGESSLVVTLLTEAQGRHAGLAKGGQSRAQAALWMPGNLVEARWLARLPEQLGALTGELVHPAAALAMEDPLALALLSAACAVAEGALPEREAHPAVFRGLVSVLAHLGGGAEGVLAEYVRWEVLLLTDLGYGLDLSSCAATGEAEPSRLTHVSPRSGRAVSMEAALPYLDRLLVLPPFLLHAGEAGEAQDWQAGLRLTAHFLARDVFGLRHRALPEARLRLMDRVARLV